jgi:hypothetical protein
MCGEKTTGLEGPRFESRWGLEIFLISKTSKPALGPTLPPIQWVPGLFSRSKLPGCEVDLLTPSNAEVMNEWN